MREPPIALALALFAAALAVLFMHLLGTPLLDRGAYRSGVGVAAAVGFLTGAAIRAMRAHERLRRLWLGVVPFAGAVVGVAVQALLLARAPETRTYILASGVTTSEPVSWVLVGAPLGALPAIVAATVLVLAFRRAARAADDRERVMLPFAGACALFGAAALGAVDGEEAPVVGGVVLLAVLALLEILVTDVARARWLRRVFAGDDPSYEIAPRAAFTFVDATPLVGGAGADAVILRVDHEPGYRGAARTPLATTSLDEAAAVAPVRRRLAVLAAILTAVPLAALAASALR